MATYTGSPLNLVIDSNQPANAIGAYEEVVTDQGSFYKSLFSPTQFSAFPMEDTSKENPSINGDLHKSSQYDISIADIVSYTNNDKLTAMKLTNADFAYLKDVGVYPNNRLIVARRFGTGVDDDLTKLSNTIPMASLISWVPENEDFISCSFGEVWEEADGNFKDILNDIGGNFKFGDSDNSSSWGNFASGLGGLVPLPGMTEGFQYKVLRNMGLTDVEASNLPFGNPNLIREAKQRKTLGPNKGSTLKARFSVKMTVNYELKYYPGIDPTIVYLDIISNALSFGTSESYFQLNNTASSKLSEFMNDIASGDPQRVKKAILLFATSVADAILTIANDLKNHLVGIANQIAKIASSEGSIAQKGADTMDVIISKVASTGAQIVQSVINKYRVKILGVINSLTGQPSAPWHVTIGNPKRPIFSSGDMLVDEVELSVGPTLGFNDLPTSIRLNLTLVNARNLGAQEIYKKFNCGRSRTYKRIPKSFIEVEQEVSQDEFNQTKTQVDKNKQEANERIRQQLDELSKKAQTTTNSVNDVLENGQSAITKAPPFDPAIDGYSNLPPSLNKFKP